MNETTNQFRQGFEDFWNRVPLADCPFNSPFEMSEWWEGWLMAFAVKVLRQGGWKKTNFSTDQEFKSWKVEQTQFGKVSYAENQ